MRNSLISRIEQIEKRTTEGESGLVVRLCRRFRRLPGDYTGGRHQVIIPDATVEGQYVIEERPWPAPEDIHALNYPERGKSYLDIELVASPPDGFYAWPKDERLRWRSDQGFDN
jgi:hypothetical protein